MELSQQNFLTGLSDLFCRYLESGDKPIYLGLSGGVDSVVLLHLLVKMGVSQRLRVLHVHHGLSQNADDWLHFCQTLCGQYKVDFRAFKVELNTKRYSIEEAARIARYRVFENALNDEAYLLMAHHAGDQAETLMFRLLRGTGGKGLAGIPESRSLAKGIIYRPLLSFDKDALIKYAKKHELQWVDDESNEDDVFSRNHIRHHIIPKLKAFETGAETRIEQAARRLAFDYQMLANLSNEKLANWQASDASLKLNELALLPQDQRMFWLRQYLEQFSLSLTQAQMQAVEASFFTQQDKQPCFQHKLARLMRHQGRLYVLPLEPQVQSSKLVLAKRIERTVDSYSLSFVEGVELDLADFKLAGKPASANLMLDNGHSRKLKKWFNDEKVPVWWREHLPYLYFQEELVAIANLWIKPEFQSRIQIDWQAKSTLTWPKD